MIVFSKTKFSKSELMALAVLLREKHVIPLEKVMIYPKFSYCTGNRNLWEMCLTGNDNVCQVSFVTKGDIKEHKLIDQLLKYFGKPDEKDQS